MKHMILSETVKYMHCAFSAVLRYFTQCQSSSSGPGSTLLHLYDGPHHQASPIFTIYQAPAQPRPCVHATTRKPHPTATMTSTIGIPIKLLNEAQVRTPLYRTP